MGAMDLCFQSSSNLPRLKSRVRIPCPALSYTSASFQYPVLIEAVVNDRTDPMERRIMTYKPLQQ